MASTATYTCICGLQKKTSNHWLLASIKPHQITFIPWDWDLALGKDIIVLCGEGCAAALLSRSLGDWKTTPAASSPRPPGDFRPAPQYLSSH